MGNKVQANFFRIGVTKDWNSRWFTHKSHWKEYLKQDSMIREYILKKLPKSGVSQVSIERSPKLMNVIIHTSRAGMVIGRGGTGIEVLKKDLKRMLKDVELRLTVEEIKNPQESSAIIALSIVEQIEKRIPFRRILKQSIDQVSQNPRIKGVKILISGRLDGAEMSRSEYLTKGKIPLATLRADIDYDHRVAMTKYGTIGVKVWLYKGNVNEKDN